MQTRTTDRKRRRALGAGGQASRLGVVESKLNHDRFAYRWVNDTPGRIEFMTQQDDWELVPQNGEKEDSTDLGAMISVVVGANPDGSGKRAYLCRKLRKYFDEDYKEAQAALDKQLEQLRRGRNAAGEHLGDYVPDGGISLT